MSLKGKTYIITGGASGLGGATARLYAENGANVVIADLKGYDELAGEIGDSARGIECDVTNTEQVQAAVDLAVETFGGLNGAVNCAGIGSAMRTTSRGVPFDLSMFEFVIKVNLIGTFNVIRLASTKMSEFDADESGERGVFINTASVAAFDGQIGQAAYSASKGGVVGMTLPIARDLAKMGMRCVTIAPGLFNTPLLAALPEEAKASLAAQVPFPPRLGEPSEFATLALEIARNQMLNGETIRLDGAIRMAPK
ncbi:MAG: 3-hydroxyacyl-CoA dehydrogenase [Candidatus Hydrogenedentota bacterium]|nr:MAG: 3-hydroxyacyl-CoA dehydrogenase [Candidatus Hydrogenedentota bacterium]